MGRRWLAGTPSLLLYSGKSISSLSESVSQRALLYFSVLPNPALQEAPTRLFGLALERDRDSCRVGAGPLPPEESHRPPPSALGCPRWKKQKARHPEC